MCKIGLKTGVLKTINVVCLACVGLLHFYWFVYMFVLVTFLPVSTTTNRKTFPSTQEGKILGFIQFLYVL